MRDLVVFLLFVGIVPLSLVRPWVGICAFTFLAYNRTQDLTWGFARGLPISQLIAVAMVIGWMAFEFRPLPVRYHRIKAMLALVGVVFLSIVANRVRWDVQGDKFNDLVKVIFVSVLTGAMLVSRERLRMIMALMSLGLGFYGAKNGVMYVLGSESIAGPGGMLKDNNDFALAMVMNVPLLVYLAKEMRSLRFGWWIARFMQVAAVLSLLTIMSTGSRGAFLSLATAAVYMAWKTKWKVPALAGLVLVGVLGFAFAPAEYKERISSMFVKAEEQDASVQGRFTSWLVATNMIRAKPVFGIGFNNMVYEYNSYTQGIYNEKGTTEQFARVAHNSYFQIWAESGTFAYLLFMFLLVGTVVTLELQRRRFRREGVLWIVPYINAIQVSMAAYIVGATFLNRAHFDFIYQLVVVAAMLPEVVAAERVASLKAERRRGPRPAQEVRVRHRDAFARVGLR